MNVYTDVKTASTLQMYGELGPVAVLDKFYWGGQGGHSVYSEGTVFNQN